MIILYAYIQIIDNIVQWQLSHLSERGARTQVRVTKGPAIALE